MITEIPLVGRAPLVEAVAARLVGLDAVSYVVAGAAGVGKTRLATEVACAVDAKGCATARIHATRAAASIPFGAFASLLPDVGTPAGGRLGWLRRAGEAVAEQAAGGGLLLVVDDAHLLDDGSAALVHHLVESARCSLLANIRTPGRAPDPITALWKDGLADRLDLDVLNEEEVEAMVTGALGGPVTGSSVRWLWEVSGGNPLYIRELLAGATDSGALRRDGGIWVLRLPLPAPPRLAELVAGRLVDIPPATAGVVDLVAVAEPLEIHILESLAPLEALDDAEQRGLVIVRTASGRSGAALAHPLYGEVRRQAMPKSRMRRLYAQLAAALAATGARRQDDTLRLARWQLDGGAPVDPELLGRAAAMARQRYDLDVASRLARAALGAGGGIPAGLALAEAEFFSGRHQEAEEVLATIYPICSSDAELAQVANARAYNLGVLMGRLEESLETVDEALERVSEPAARAQLILRRAVTRVWAADVDAALDDAAVVMHSEDPLLAQRGRSVAALALAFLGRADEALAMVGATDQPGDPERGMARLASAQLIPVAVSMAGAGRLLEAASLATDTYRALLATGDKEAVATWCLLAGLVSVEQGSLADAALMFREGAALNRELSDVPTLRWCLGGVALAEGMAGAPAPAAEALAELDTLGSHWFALLDADLVHRGRAWALVAAGELSAARQVLRDAAQHARGRRLLVPEARLLHDLARLGEPAPAVERLSELAGAVDGQLVAALAAHARALVGGGAGDLSAVADRLEQLGSLRLASEAAAAAEAAFRSEGLLRQAGAAAHRAVVLRDRCGGPPTAGVVDGGDAARLTRREREVAALAASGIASREIASRLFVSVRTVDNHLQRVYAKLGVSGRQELGAALGRL